MAQTEAPHKADSSLITSATRKKPRGLTPVSEAAPSREGTPLTSIFPQAKKARRATPTRFNGSWDKGIQEKVPATPSAAPQAPDAASTPASQPSSRSATPEAIPRAATPLTNPQDDSDLESDDSHIHDAENRHTPVPRSVAQRDASNGKHTSGIVLERGADGVPGKSGSPGRSVSPARSASQDAAVVPSSTDADTATCAHERSALCAIDSRETLDGAADGDLEVVAFDDEDMDGEEDAFDPYSFIKGLPPLAQCTPPGRKLLLPRQTRRCKRKTLVLDLDETLVHSSLQEEVSAQPDFVFPVAFNGRDHMVQVRKRPHLHKFLERCAELFEVVIFTASQKIYAEQLLNVIDPKRQLIRHRIFRDSCVFVEGNYLKDLSSLGRDLAHTVIIDNSVQAFGFQLKNGIPIESWYEDAEDEELLHLLPFLERCAAAEDVRPLIANEFKVEQLVANAAGNYYTPMAYAA